MEEDGGMGKMERDGKVKGWKAEVRGRRQDGRWRDGRKVEGEKMERQETWKMKA